MNVDDTIRSRRSIRRFDGREVSEDLVEELLDLVRHTPSSMNGQPWVFVIIRDLATKKKIAAAKNAHCPADKAHFSADFLIEAPVLVAICVDKARSHHRERENGILAAGTLMLAARSRGLGSVYLSAYQRTDPSLQNEIGEILDLPAEIEPVTLIPLGFPAETPGEKILRPLEELLRHV